MFDLEFVLAGISIKSAPLDVLERAAVAPPALPAMLRQLARHAGEGVILSTCNRTELYSCAEDAAEGEKRLFEFIGRLFEADGNRVIDLAPHLYLRSGDSAIVHLLRVVSGVDSMAVGESEIVGQVTDAFEAAVRDGSVSTPLSRLFHHAFLFGRRVRDVTGINRDRISLPSIGVQLIERSAGGLQGRSALLIGAGDTGLLTARALAYRGIGKLMVASRSHERASDLARELAAHPIAFDAIADALPAADIVITCTSAPDTILSRDTLVAATEGRTGSRLIVLDLALPRDVEAAASDLPGVELITLDGLQEIAEEHRSNRLEAAKHAESLIGLEVRRFRERLIEADSEPVIRSLGSRAESIRLREVERAVRRLPSLSDGQRGIIDAMSKAIVSKLIADPISFLRSASSEEAASAVQRVFDLSEDDEDN